jgi:hypothetical protein
MQKDTSNVSKPGNENVASNVINTAKVKEKGDFFRKTLFIVLIASCHGTMRLPL